MKSFDTMISLRHGGIISVGARAFGPLLSFTPPPDVGPALVAPLSRGEAWRLIRRLLIAMACNGTRTVGVDE